MSEGRWTYFTGSDSETAYHFAHGDEPYHDAAVAEHLNALERDLQEALVALRHTDAMLGALARHVGMLPLTAMSDGMFLQWEATEGQRRTNAALLARHRKEGE